MHPGWTRRRAGAISLVIAVVGLITLHVIQHHGIGPPVAMRVLTGCFEAATVGGLADWFAVTALFRRIPIPVISRHTNLLVKHRRKFTAGIVDVVQNRWLAPAVVRERLQAISGSSLLIAHLSAPASRRRSVAVLRGFLTQVGDQLDSPAVVGFLDRLLRGQMRTVDIGRPLGQWILGALERGEHGPLWSTILASTERGLRGGDLEKFLAGTLQSAVDDYAATDWKKRLFVQGATAIGGIDYAVAADRAIEALSRALGDARDDADHPLRRIVDGAIESFARELCEGRGEATRVVSELQRRLADDDAAREIVRGILTRLKHTLAVELSREDSDLSMTLDRLLSGVVADLEANVEMRDRLDAWMRESVADLVKRHHGLIGEMVEASMTRLTDEELTQEVQGKVGDDLQMIRVNGAVIGALVGGLLTGAKIFYGL